MVVREPWEVRALATRERDRSYRARRRVGVYLTLAVLDEVETERARLGMTRSEIVRLAWGLSRRAAAMVPPAGEVTP